MNGESTITRPSAASNANVAHFIATEAGRPLAFLTAGGQVPNLKKLDPEECAGNHLLQRHVHRHNGKWRDAQVLGTQSPLKDRRERRWPEKNAPALIGAGMMGDRTDIIFADPSEIGAFIAAKCE